MKFFAFPLSSLSLLILLPLMSASVEYDVTLFAGGISGYADGIGTNAQINSGNIRISPNGLFALFTDTVASFIRMVDLSTDSVTTFAGGWNRNDSATFLDPTPGIGTNSKFNSPQGVSISPDNSFALMTDSRNNLIRHIDLSSAFVSILAGVVSAGYADGAGTNSAFNYPYGVAISPDGLYALVTDYNNNVIRHIDLSTATVTTLAGASYGLIDGIGTNSNFFSPCGIAISADGSFALVADYNNHAIRHIDLLTASVTTLAGAGPGSAGRVDGQGTNARFSFPLDVSISPNGRYALVADTISNLIRRIDISTGTVTRAAGEITESDHYYGPQSFLFILPYSISISPDDTYTLVVDSKSIRKLTPNPAEGTQ
jgi:DNA-binding beta-propeller fold protein YncE